MAKPRDRNVVQKEAEKKFKNKNLASLRSLLLIILSSLFVQLAHIILTKLLNMLKSLKNKRPT